MKHLKHLKHLNSIILESSNSNNGSNGSNNMNRLILEKTGSEQNTDKRDKKIKEKKASMTKEAYEQEMKTRKSNTEFHKKVRNKVKKNPYVKKARENIKNNKDFKPTSKDTIIIKTANTLGQIANNTHKGVNVIKNNKGKLGAGAGFLIARKVLGGNDNSDISDKVENLVETSLTPSIPTGSNTPMNSSASLANKIMKKSINEFDTGGWQTEDRSKFVGEKKSDGTQVNAIAAAKSKDDILKPDIINDIRQNNLEVNKVLEQYPGFSRMSPSGQKATIIKLRNSKK